MKIKIQKKEKRRAYKQRGRYTRLTDAQWEELKLKHFNNPLHYTYEFLAHEYGTSIPVVRLRSKKERWEDQRKDIVLASKEKVRDRILELFIEAGMPPLKLIKLIIEGAKGTKKYTNIKKLYENLELPRSTRSKNQEKVKIFKLKPFSVDHTILADDNEVTFRYRELCAKIMLLLPLTKTKRYGEEELGDNVDDKVWNLNFIEIKKPD